MKEPQGRNPENSPEKSTIAGDSTGSGCVENLSTAV